MGSTVAAMSEGRGTEGREGVPLELYRPMNIIGIRGY